MTLFCFRDGAVIPKNQLTLSVDDLGFSRGYCLFEHCRTYFGRPFHLCEHYLRLLRSARFFSLRLALSCEELEDILYTLMKRNAWSESGFKIYLSAGLSADGLTPVGKESLLISPYPMTPYSPSTPTRGLVLKTTLSPRAFPYHKTTFYLPGLLAKQAQAPCDDILFINPSRHLLESSTAGFLAFMGNTLIAPEGELLTSITREVLVMLAQGRFKIEYRPLSYTELPLITEAFLCSTTKEILPIASIDDIVIGNTLPGKNTAELKTRLTDYITKQHWPLLSTFYDDLSVISLR